MKEKVGNVTINYDFYGGKELYSDGDEIEGQLLEICKNKNIKKALLKGDKWPILYHLSDIRENLIEWYPFKQHETVLEIGSGCGALTGVLARKLGKVTCIELSKRRSLINAYRNQEQDNVEIIVGNFSDIEIAEKYDYITLIGVLEYSGYYIQGENPFLELIKKVRGYLKEDGKIIIAIENKMGIKYLNGAKEDHVLKSFVGIEDYRYIHGVRTFSKPELCELFRLCGIEDYTFYYPVPDYKLPDTIYSDEILPRKGDIRTWGINYDNIRIGLYNEAIMADQICNDMKFDYLSNSFLVVCNEKENAVFYAHYTKTRKEAYQTATRIYKDGDKIVVGKSYEREAVRTYDIFQTMVRQRHWLQKEFPTIEFLKPEMRDGILVYDFAEGIPVDWYIAEKVHDITGLLERINEIISKYVHPDNKYFTEFVVTEQYERTFGKAVVNTCEKSLAVTNMDMIWSNLILQDGKVLCFDYEWIFDFPIPYEYVLYRSVEAFYIKYGMYFSRSIALDEFAKKVGIEEMNIPVYRDMQKSFYAYVHGDNQEYQYLKRYIKPCGMIQLSI